MHTLMVSSDLLNFDLEPFSLIFILEYFYSKYRSTFLFGLICISKFTRVANIFDNLP